MNGKRNVQTQWKSTVGSPLCVCVGGSRLIALPFWVNSCLHAWLTDWPQNRSRGSIESVIYGIWGGSQCTEGSSDVIKGHPCIPCRLLAPATKRWYGVKAWNIGKAMHRSGPSPLAISWAAICRKLFLVPKLTHSSVMSRRWAAVTASTSTSMSTVRIDTLVLPFLQRIWYCIWWLKATVVWRYLEGVGMRLICQHKRAPVESSIIPA